MKPSNGEQPLFTESPNMNSETIYTVLLDAPRQIDGKTWHGLSYQLSRSTGQTFGKIEVCELGWPTKLTLWEQDGPELDSLDEATVKGMIEVALPVDADYVIPPPPVPHVPTYTPEQWVSQHLSPLQVAALSEFRLGLLQAGKTLGPNMAGLKGWLEGMMAESINATPRNFPAPPCDYMAASAEAVAGLQG